MNENYTSDWFSHHIPAWRSFFDRFDVRQPLIGVEIGVFEGRSAVWLLDHVLLHPQSRLHCIDVFAGYDQPDSYWHRFRANVERFGEKAVIHHGGSFDHMLRLVADGLQVDFVYVDGSHRASDVLEDLILGFHLLKPGGLMICDDYLGGSGSNQDMTLGSPKYAVDTFTTMYRDRLQIIGGQPLYQLAMTKTSDRSNDDRASRGG